MKNNNHFPTPLAGNNHHIFLNESSKKLVLLFSAMNMKEGQFNYKQAGRTLDENVIFLNDTSNQWYQEGIESLGDTFKTTIETIKQWIKVLNIEEVYTIGTSMGGYAAIHYGIHLNAKILSFATTTVLNTPHCESKSKIKPSTQIICNDLRTIVNDSQEDIFLICGESDPLDVFSASLLKDYKKVKLISLKGVDHYVPTALARDHALFSIFNTFVKNGEPDISKLTNKGLIFESKDTAKLLYNAYKFQKNGMYVSAELEAIKVLEKYPYSESALFILGKSLLKQNKYKDAAYYFSMAYSMAPDIAEYAFFYSHAIRLDGAKIQSIYLLDNLLKKFPNYSRAYYAKGIILASEKKFKYAIQNINLAIKLDPYNKSYKKGLEKIKKKAKSYEIKKNI